VKQPNAESGVIFIAALILLAGMSVVIVALAHEVSLDLKMAASLVEADQALEIAKVGIDKAVYAVNNDPNWRTTYASGTTYGPFALGDGSFTTTITDEDGDLADSPLDSVTVTSVATYKGATRTVSAVLAPQPHETLMYLASMWDLGKKIEIKDGPRVYGDLMSDNHVTVDAPLPDFRGDIYCRDKGLVDEELDDADTNVIQIDPTPTDPDPDFNWFISRGARISPPLIGDKYVIEDKVISPTRNPYGFTNAEGIYYIHGDKETRFVRCHITATIVVATNKKVNFEDACVHAPAFSHYPALLVGNEVLYKLDESLSEAQSGIDFNGDGDQSDTFTPHIRGIVYAKTKFFGLQYEGGTNIVRFTGAIISREMALIGAGCIFEQDATLSTTLVNGFLSGKMKLVTGSIKIE